MRKQLAFDKKKRKEKGINICGQLCMSDLEIASS